MTEIKELPTQQCRGPLLALKDSLDLCGGKWKLIILVYLAASKDEKQFFMQMRRDIGGISAKVLSSELKDLEINKLVSRTVCDTQPVTVVYGITEHGKTILPVVEALIRWGHLHRQKFRLS